MLTLAINPAYFINLGIVALVGVCVLMVLVVLIQRPQGGGLSGAFGAGGGGAGAGQTAFGTKTGDVLTYATIGVFLLYLLVAIGLNFATRPYTGNANQLPVATVPGAEQTPAEENSDEAIQVPAEGQIEGMIEDAADEVDQVDQVIDDGGLDPATDPAIDPAIDPVVDPASAEQP